MLKNKDKMMKKTYINPETVIVNIACQTQILTGSSKGISNETPTEWGSRGSDLWDDEE